MKKDYQSLYPAIYSKDTELIIETVVNNKRSTSSESSALLFTGGVDSTTALLRQRSDFPRLINIIQKKDEDTKAVEQSEYISKLSSDIGTEYNTIKTNAHSLLKTPYLSMEFYTGGKWWNTIHYAIYYLSVAAPVTYKYNCNKLLQASTYAATKNIPDAQTININNVKWSDIDCSITEEGMSRPEKMKIISEEIDGLPIKISSCYNRDSYSNCNECEKCYRNIISAAAIGLHPSKIGYALNKDVINNMRSYVNDKNIRQGTIQYEIWKEIKKHVERGEFIIDGPSLKESILLINELEKEDTVNWKRKISNFPYPIDYALLIAYENPTVRTIYKFFMQ